MDFNLALYVLISIPLSLFLIALVLFFLDRQEAARVDQTRERAQLVTSDEAAMEHRLAEARAGYLQVAGKSYSKMVHDIDKTTDTLRSKSQELNRIRSDFEFMCAQRPADLPTRLLLIVRDGRTHRRLRRAVDQTCENVEKAIGEGLIVLKRCESQPEVAAERMHIARGKRQALVQHIARLEKAGLHGLESAHIAAEEAEMQEKKLPENLSGKDQHQLTSQALDILEELKPILDEWLKKLSKWRDTHLQAKELSTRLMGQVKYVQEDVERNAPLALSGLTFRQRLQEIQTSLAALDSRLAAASVEDLDAILKELLEQEKRLKACTDDFDNATQHSTELEEGLKELDKKYHALPASWTHSVYPDYSIELDETNDWLDVLRPRLEPFLGGDKKFLAEELEASLEKVRLLQGELDHLLEKKEICLKDFKSLVNLLESDDLRGGEKWCQEARTALLTAQKYSEKNWSGQAKISKIARDLNTLEVLQRSYVDAAERPAYCESELKEDLAHAEKLAELHKQVRADVAQIAGQVVQVSAQEDTAKAEIGRAIATLQELMALQAKTPMLLPAVEGELRRLNEQAESLKEDINHPLDNSLKSKTDRLKALTDLLQRHYNRWLEQLAERLREETRKLSAQMKELEQVARFNDPEVKEAEKLLNNLGTSPSFSRASSYYEAATSLVRCAEAYVQVSTRGDDLLKGAALVTLSARQEAENARTAAAGAFEKGDKSLHDPNWSRVPPDWQKAQKEQEQLAKRLSGLRGGHWDASELSKRYREIASELNAQKTENERWVSLVEGERSRLVAEEDALNNVISLLKSRPELRARAQESSRTIAELKRVYGNGSRTCDQVLAEMKALEDELSKLYYAR